MKEVLDKILTSFFSEVTEITSSTELNNLRIKYLGKNGELTSALKSLKDIAPEQRPAVGQMINNARVEIESRLEKAQTAIKEIELNKKLLEEKLDITLPVKNLKGGLHPQTIVRNQIIDIFVSMGFSVEDGREIETEYYNFEALNIPDDHPSKDMQDTFYITNNLKYNILLRSQTSNTQIHVMENTKPPIKMLNPGRVYRCDDIDATHSPMFHQIEGLMVDKGINMCHLKGVLDTFVKRFFGEKTTTRLRPSFFPFTEPSVEVDASCPFCQGSGCKVCKNSGWIEILGAGMVNRKVLANCGIDPDVYSGFAFGMGLDRITNIKYDITDLRLVFENDIRFTKQFG